MSTPLLIVSDSVAGTSGLGRIARELANHIHADLSDVFRVGVAGVGGNHTSRLPYPNYPIQQLQAMIPMDLPKIWADFAGDEKGIMLLIFNISWCAWAALPERLPQGLPLREFLCIAATKPENVTDETWNKLTPQMKKVLGKRSEGPFKKWLYCPVDGDLPDGTLGRESEAILKGFDRVLAYTRYGGEVIAKTMRVPSESVPNLPHGLDASIFYPRDRAEARKTFISRVNQGKGGMPIYDDITLLGCVATNSFRKSWGVVFETASELLKRGKSVFLWGHTNGLGVDGDPKLYWNLLSLAEQFNMGQRVILTTSPLSDEDMAWCLSALDVYIANGRGEGWGLTGAEALACNIPVVHGNYAGSTDFIAKEYLVDFPAYDLESKWMIRRPTFRASDFADKVEFCLTPEGKSLAKLPDYILWENCWPEWKKWLLAGVPGGVEASQVHEMAPSDSIGE